MENSQPQKQPRFGLTVNQALYHGIALIIIHSLACSLRIWKKLSFEEFKVLRENGKSMDDYVEWYIYYPLLFLAFLVFSEYFDCKYPNKSFFSFQRFVLPFLIYIAIAYISRVTFLTFLYYYFN